MRTVLDFELVGRYGYDAIPTFSLFLITYVIFSKRIMADEMLFLHYVAVLLSKRSGDCTLIYLRAQLKCLYSVRKATSGLAAILSKTLRALESAMASTATHKVGFETCGIVVETKHWSISEDHVKPANSHTILFPHILHPVLHHQRCPVS